MYYILCMICLRNLNLKLPSGKGTNVLRAKNKQETKNEKLVTKNEK